MYSLLLFLVTFCQLLLVGGSYYQQSSQLFYISAVYGSPLYYILHFDATLILKNPAYIAILVYHIVKYIIFYLAPRNEGHSGMLISAIIFEAAYLCTSAYFMNYIN